MVISDFYNLHKGETALIIGNGKGLNDIPLWFLKQYPSFGSNCIFYLEGFKPTYYAAVDQKMQRLYGDEVAQKLRRVPKFLPGDRFDWKGENMHHFHHRAGEMWLPEWEWGKNTLTLPGITFTTVTHVLLQLAYFMGFETMLCVGLDNSPDGSHFYGNDISTGGADVKLWDAGYGELAKGMAPRKIINLSTHTQVTTLPLADWKKYGKE
jgi:hypothetical protein